MSVWKKLYDYSVDSYSPVIDTYERVEKVDKKGNHIVTYEKVDFDKIIERNGTVDMWSLDALLKAGINPGSFNIHTGYATRLDGISAIQDIESQLDQLDAQSAPAEPAVEDVKE